MDIQGSRARILQFLETIQRADADEIDDDDGLIDCGLIDSLAILEIIAFLEAEFGIDFSEAGVDPGELQSIQAILSLIQKHSRES